jgi:hypothetical protein
MSGFKIEPIVLALRHYVQNLQEVFQNLFEVHHVALKFMVVEKHFLAQQNVLKKIVLGMKLSKHLGHQHLRHLLEVVLPELQ